MRSARLIAICVWLSACRVAAPPPSAPPAPPLAGHAAAPVHLPRGDPARAGLDPERLAAFVERARAEGSTALVLVVDGQLVVEEFFGTEPDRPSLAMSVTKSVVALAMGGLVDDGFIDIDAPLASTLLPEWAGTDKAGITARHLMSQTSGLDTARFDRVDEGERSRATIEAHALASPLRTPPGSTFRYNNNAVDLLAVVARRAEPEGAYLDDYMQRRLFGPLDLSGVYWIKDARGDPRAAGGLVIRPSALARLGQLVLDGGRAGERQLVGEAFIEAMLAPSPVYDRYGLLWWRDGPVTARLTPELMERWGAAGVDPKILKALQAIVGREFPGTPAIERALAERIAAPELASARAALRSAGVPFREERIEPLAWRADGYLGQYIVIVPDARLVAVRMRDPRATSFDPEEYTWPSFGWEVLELAGHPVPAERRR